MDVSWGPPVTTWTAELSRYLGIMSAIRSWQETVVSAGLTITQQPALMAAISGDNVTMKGKFHVAMTRATPRGSFRMRAPHSVPNRKPASGVSSAAHASTFLRWAMMSCFTPPMSA